jgi:hypothetical protein
MDGIEGYRHILFAHSEESPNANNEGNDLAVLVGEYVVDLPNPD